MTISSFEAELTAGEFTLSVRQELLGPEAYLEFLSRSALGEQYPQEDFHERIAVLLQNLQIRLVARHPDGHILAICFGLTDFAYWLFVTDLGVDRRFERLGIGRQLMAMAHALAGGESNIVQCCYANDDAVPFYEKIGMRRSNDVMEKDHVRWTDFIVGARD